MRSCNFAACACSAPQPRRVRNQRHTRPRRPPALAGRVSPGRHGPRADAHMHVAQHAVRAPLDHTGRLRQEPAASRLARLRGTRSSPDGVIVCQTRHRSNRDGNVRGALRARQGGDRFRRYRMRPAHTRGHIGGERERGPSLHGSRACSSARERARAARARGRSPERRRTFSGSFDACERRKRRIRREQRAPTPPPGVDGACRCRTR